MIDVADSPLVDVMIQPVRGQLAFESCVEQLGSAIRLGVFRPGDRLPPERELATRLDVSRATLREAISALRTAGFVATTRGRGGGTVVQDVHGRTTPITGTVPHEARLAEIVDVVVFRAVVEPGAAETAAAADLSPGQRDLLRDSLAEVEAARDPEPYRQADARLHLAIASVCGSDELSKACSTVQVRVHALLERIPFLASNIVHSDAQHREIVEAILAGDPARARTVMREHCDGTAALLKGLVK